MRLEFGETNLVKIGVSALGRCPYTTNMQVQSISLSRDMMPTWFHGLRCGDMHINQNTSISADTSTGRKFALVEGVNHDLVCAGSNYHVHFAWQVWHGQYSPGFKFNKLKSFSRVEIDRTHVDLKDSRGKGFAVRRLNKHNFCPASVYHLDR